MRDINFESEFSSRKFKKKKNFHNNAPMNFKFSTNFLLPYARKPAKYDFYDLDATPTVLILIGHPIVS